jgi:hypothetical protein
MEKELRMWLWRKWFIMNRSSKNLNLFGVWLKSQTEETIETAKEIFKMEQNYKKNASTGK